MAKKAVNSKKAAGKPSSLLDTRVIYCGDNLEQLKKFPENSVDLIYIDPPFNSNRNYEVFWGETKERRAFEDRHASTQAYIEFMRPRCVELYRVLKKTGSFYYHCDWHASHYIKIMLDQLFGNNQFQTEIIWKRTNAKGLAFRSFPSDHDSIFYYTKSDDYTFNRQYLPHDEGYVKDFYKNVEPETGRQYQLADLTNPNKDRPNLTYEFLGVKRVWRWTKERMQEAYEKGLIVQSSPGAVPRLKRYLDEQEGIPVDSVWADIPPIQSQSEERLGYPTQKPLALLDRIVNASSNPNDIVLDAFCGCGTAPLPPKISTGNGLELIFRRLPAVLWQSVCAMSAKSGKMKNSGVLAGVLSSVTCLGVKSSLGKFRTLNLRTGRLSHLAAGRISRRSAIWELTAVFILSPPCQKKSKANWNLWMFGILSRLSKKTRLADRILILSRLL
jgi:DNA modification methylase